MPWKVGKKGVWKKLGTARAPRSYSQGGGSPHGAPDPERLFPGALRKRRYAVCRTFRVRKEGKKTDYAEEACREPKFGKKKNKKHTKRVFEEVKGATKT